jgi:hypothetical protein
MFLFESAGIELIVPTINDVQQLVELRTKLFQENPDSMPNPFTENQERRFLEFVNYQ